MQLCIGAAQGPYSRGSQMRKLLLLFALFAIGTGCSSPVAEVEEADPNVANFFDPGDCPEPPEANPDPNTWAYYFWLFCNEEGEG